MSIARYLIPAILAAALVAAATWFLGDDEPPVRTSLAVAEALSADTAGYARAVEPRAFTFPEDHGPHPDFRTEWWYYTGNLTGRSGRHFGYQLTIFRTALRPAEFDDPDSTWSTRHLYMAHFALSDMEAGRFHAFERFSRGAAGLAGATAEPYSVWLEDWRIDGPTADSVRITSGEDDVAIDLVLRRVRPIVLQGDEGLDRKGPEPGNASYYYSMTRLRTSGTVTIGGESYDVQGLSWLDREWSTSALGEDQVGWDWFSLQLDDGRDVMYYRIRQRDGGTSPFSNGVVVAANGSVTRLSRDDVELQPIRYWESRVSGARYPVRWTVRIRPLQLDLDLVPYVDDQELNHAVAYWEGAVRVEGDGTGRGFVEMTGYADEGNGANR